MARAGVEQQIIELEKRISETKYNKKTQHAIGLYKAQLAKLKDKQETRRSSGGKGEGYSVKKSGDASVILIGFPSVGKSTLLNALTDAKSQVGSYAFTTLDVVPGLMKYNQAKIQILDVPGIVKGAASGRGRGKEVLSVMRNADLVVFLIDVNFPEHYKVLDKEVYDTHLRLNQSRPDVTIKKTAKGGIDVGTTCKLTKLDEQTIKDILKEFKINNAQVIIRENITADQFIDCIKDNKIYIPGITVLTKIDLAEAMHLKKIEKKVKPDLSISAEKRYNIDKLKKLIFKKLNFMRVYTKEQSKKPDLKEPMIVKKGSTVRDICNKLHRDFAKKFRFVRVWGPSARFPGQKLSLNHVLKDKDIVEIHI